MSNRYTVEQEEPYTIEVFYDESDVPGLRQPFWPNGEPWESAEEAEEWAIQFIDSIENEDSPFPQAGRGEPRMPKPEPQPEENLELESSDSVLEIEQ